MSRQVEGLRRFVGRPAGRARTFTNVVVTAGGKGGVGTSSVTALIGLGLARAGRRVLIVDGSDGSVHLHFGLDAGTGLMDFGRRNVDSPRLDWVDPGLAVIASGHHVDSSPSSVRAMERRNALARVASLHTTFDLVLIDAGSGVDSVVQACSLGVDRVITITDAGRLSMAGTFGLLRAVSARFPGLALQLVVNREPEENVKRVDSRVRSALQHFHAGEVRTLGSIPFDHDLEETTRRDGLLQDLTPSSHAARAALRLGLMLNLEAQFADPHPHPESPSDSRQAAVRALEPTGT